MKKRVSDALYSLCKSHCKNKPHGLFPFLIFFHFFFYLRKEKLYMCTITVNWKDRNVPMCVSMFPSVWRFPWERLSVRIQHLGRRFGQKSLAQFWKAEQQQLNLTKTVTKDGSLDVILDVYDIDFCMWRIHSYREKPFHSEKTQDLYFRKSSSRLRSSSNVSTRESMYIYGSPSCLSHD